MSYPPPPAPPPGPPLGAAPESMPGSTKGAVVLLWILFGLGICGSGALAAGYFLLAGLEEQGDVVIPSSYAPYLVIAIVQAVIWTVLRAVFAVKIARRSAGARKGAIIFELINLGLAALSWIFAPELEYTAGEPAGGAAGGLIGALLGAAVAAVIIGLLSTADSKRWCNE